jgi:hypothetical protein
MDRHVDHRFVSSQFRQPARVNAIYFQEIEGRLNCRPLVAVKVSLALGNVEVLCGRDLVKGAVPVEIHVQRLRDGRFQAALVPQAVNPTMLVDLIRGELSRFAPTSER